MKKRTGSLTRREEKERYRQDYFVAKAQWETVKLAGILTVFLLIVTAVVVWILLFTSSNWGILIWILGILIAGVWGAWRLLRIHQRATEELKVTKETGQ